MVLHGEGQQVEESERHPRSVSVGGHGRRPGDLQYWREQLPVDRSHGFRDRPSLYQRVFDPCRLRQRAVEEMAVTTHTERTYGRLLARVQPCVIRTAEENERL